MTTQDLIAIGAIVFVAVVIGVVVGIPLHDRIEERKMRQAYDEIQKRIEAQCEQSVIARGDLDFNGIADQLNKERKDG